MEIGKMENIYRKAIELIKQRGRCRSALCGENKAVCLIGALAMAKGLSEETLRKQEKQGYCYQYIRKEVAPVAQIIRENYKNLCSNDLDQVWKFNDYPETTNDDVILVLEKAAIQWDELNG